MTEQKSLHVRQAEGLRALADMIEANPELAEHLSQALQGMAAYVFTAEPIAAFVRAAGRHGAKIVKDYPDDPERHFSAYAHFGDEVAIRLHTTREQVCERVVTGTETVTETVPDPEKLAEVPTVEVTKTVETVEWVCRPLLAAEHAPAVTS
ncbi:hypothetical protein ACIBCH_20875 [Amycolatopsis thailandensis]|uniref:hypothetical protein n=1 Tax=Amycolatopsis thailandensis TaxID=589330 RepID=UPI00378C4BFC